MQLNSTRFFHNVDYRVFIAFLKRFLVQGEASIHALHSTPSTAAAPQAPYHVSGFRSSTIHQLIQKSPLKPGGLAKPLIATFYIIDVAFFSHTSLKHGESVWGKLKIHKNPNVDYRVELSSVEPSER
ncbi:unnamed protein product [Thelazia callipaeda]|uniref:OB_NTP_bind domain-containing protein n=1 Tax=Thelazia callipaeda TaxID=103827 RepID=A0A0N5DCI5_THECL|nr:unnamed protein product [Thelazia callipaeda]